MYIVEAQMKRASEESLAVRGGQCGGGRPPGGVQGAACAIPTEGAGPGSGREGPPKTRLDGFEGGNFRLDPKTRAGS